MRFGGRIRESLSCDGDCCKLDKLFVSKESSTTISFLAADLSELLLIGVFCDAVVVADVLPFLFVRIDLVGLNPVLL